MKKPKKAKKARARKGAPAKCNASSPQQPEKLTVETESKVQQKPRTLYERFRVVITTVHVAQWFYDKILVWVDTASDFSN